MSLNIILRHLFKLVRACSSLSLLPRSHFTLFPHFTFHFGVCTRAFQATRPPPLTPPHLSVWPPQANMVHYIFNVVCNCSALSTHQEQITFLGWRGEARSFALGAPGSQSVSAARNRFLPSDAERHVYRSR